MNHKYDTLLIVDWHNLHRLNNEDGRPFPSQECAESLSKFIKPFGNNNRLLAFIDKHVPEDEAIYKNAGYDTITLNGNRSTKLKWIQPINRTLDIDPPKRLILVSADPAFEALLLHAQKGQTKSELWAPDNSISSSLINSANTYRPLEALLDKRVDIRLDYENIHIGLRERGFQISPKVLIESIKAKACTLGGIRKITAYADWELLSRSSSFDLKAELASIEGVELSEQHNIYGKNSADMQIADDIRTLCEQPPGVPDFAETIVLCTGDRDFRPVINTIQERGKTVHIFSVKGCLSQTLKEVVNEIHYFEDLLPQQIKVKPTDELVEPTMRIMALLKKRKWTYVYHNKLLKLVGKNSALYKHRALEERILIRDGNKFLVNQNHHLIEIINHLLQWVEWRISERRKEGHPHGADIDYLVNGMRYDQKLVKWNVGQNKHEAKAWLLLISETGFINKKTVTVFGK